MRIVFGMLLVALVLVAGPRSAMTQGVVNREPTIKAVYIYKFIRYVTWPNNAFADADAPLVIGVVGKDPVNPRLRAIAAKKKAGNRPLEVVPVATPDQAAGCHIVFVGDTTPVDTVTSITASIVNSGQPTLLVGEVPGFVGDPPNMGGTIEFMLIDNNVKIKLSRGAAQRANLKISSQLLKLSKVVP